MAELIMQNQVGEMAAKQTIPAGYKQTEVGVIPQEWSLISLNSIVDGAAPICYGVVQVGKYDEAGIPIIAIKFLKNISTAPLHRTSIEIEKPYVRSRLKKDDVLISIKGTIGHIGVVPEGFEGNISREIARIRLRDGIFSKYVAHQLEAPATQERISKSVVGTTRLEFSISAVREFLIPIPSDCQEQKQIADVLSDCDALIAGLEYLISKKKAIKTATMQQLLTGRTRLPLFALHPDGTTKGYKSSELGQIPQDWEVAPIGSVLSITTGAKNTQDKVDDGRYPFFVRSQTVERINTYSFDGEAVLTAGDGVGTGKVFHYINGKFDFHQRVYLMHNFGERVSGYFFYLFFSNHFFDRIMSMTAKSSVDSVRREMITDMKMVLPSKAEQTAIATILSDMDSELAALEQKLAKARDVKQGMMQQLLTGRIRLPLPQEA